MKFCINNGLIVDPHQASPFLGNLVIENGIITEIVPAKQNPAAVQSDSETAHEGTIEDNHTIDVSGKADVHTIDARGNWVVPGLIDLHVHFREPGFEYKEDIQSGCESAAAGGFTMVCCMPNTSPVIDTPEVVRFIRKKADAGNGVDVSCIGAISKGQDGIELVDYEGMLVDGGICGISEDGKTVADESVMLEAMKKAKELGLTVYSHAEPEAEIVKRDLALAKQSGCRLHFCHISEKASIALIRHAKEGGLAVTAETAPHYFALTSEEVQGDPNKKMNPPLGTKADREAVMQALRDGTLDAIATDHAPHHINEKSVPYELAPNGVIGLETSFAISYTKLVRAGILTPAELVKKMSCKPAEILGIHSGRIEIGRPADLAIIDVEAEYEIGSEPFRSKSANSPFLGERVFGRILYTIKDGAVIWNASEASGCMKSGG
ncbi:dihydroorotase [Anoxybacterium hadale]|uniref:Dihydroorotase n=1 Tax=Anoxybacterium hadale TaxID=3408580 RepID=A0ACD1A7C1_9FIRM|nr:dihydroorotase [Clostridiales bacterium]